MDIFLSSSCLSFHLPPNTHTPLYFYYKKRNNEIQFQPENTGKRLKDTKKENFTLGVRKEKVGKSGMTRR
jgi:hypothetical protein